MEKELVLTFEQCDIIHKALYVYANKINSLSGDSEIVDLGLRGILDERVKQIWSVNTIISDSPFKVEE